MWLGLFIRVAGLGGAVLLVWLSVAGLVYWCGWVWLGPLVGVAGCGWARLSVWLGFAGPVYWCAS